MYSGVGGVAGGTGSLSLLDISFVKEVAEGSRIESTSRSVGRGSEGTGGGVVVEGDRGGQRGAGRADCGASGWISGR